MDQVRFFAFKVFSGKTGELIHTREVAPDEFDGDEQIRIPDFRATEHHPVEIHIEYDETSRALTAALVARLVETHVALA